MKLLPTSATLMLVAILSACQPPPSSPAAPSTTAPNVEPVSAPPSQPVDSSTPISELDLATLPTALSCAQTVAAIQERWTALEPATLRMGMTDDQREAVIESSGGASVPVGFGVFVQHGELRLADEHAPRGLASDAGRELARLNRSRTGMPNLMKPWPALVAVTREPTVTLHVVSALESLAAAGVPTYLVARKAGAPMLPAPSFAERVHAHQDISGSAIRVLQELEGSVKSCPSLSGMLEVLVVGADPRQVASKVQEIVPTGLAGCACDADTPTLYRLWTELLFQGVAVIGKRVTLETGPKAALVQVEGLDGAAFYDAMPSDGRPVRFR